ncbi:hypothetical protein ABZ816_00255 [Actinosynnema sp. NPDC047251]|uniref:Uncharacterized protein n=1 Tax=Saccharothrix espanaensis (strain ATCC 51144 / DSM 44229 / JCM 9112 / NBRC 15066 / NRRL 15764) TaxID=1179773 RepID=K0JSK7_SACES|nr:hypothetical protein [Saccharothrix espanaensis]CCH30685.1 hypothetical protein BN6_33850 [Saccharothrix espanaensis DSM 44229]
MIYREDPQVPGRGAAAERGRTDPGKISRARGRVSDGKQLLDRDPDELWDDELGAVSGGVNWSSDLDAPPGEHLTVIGPDFDDAAPAKVDW